MISLTDYQMPRFPRFSGEWTPEIQGKAEEWCRRVNLLLAYAAADGVYPGTDAATNSPVASGWRPKAVNDRTANAAKASTHLTGEGGDLQDHADSRALARWCLANQHRLEECGLWMEDPQWTGGPDPWVHLDMRPRSVRVYRPNMNPPPWPALPEQVAA